MELSKYPELLDRLAASHALGTLRGPARRRFEAMARERPAVRARVLLWRERLAAMTEIQTEVQPSPELWPRIARSLATSAPPVRTPPLGERALNWWRGLALASALTAALALIVLLPRDAPEQFGYIGVLSDERQQAVMLVTYDATQASLRLRRLGQYRTPENKSLQLWALPPGAAPRSLGVLSDEGVLQLPVAERGSIVAPTLAVSIEPKGGVSGDSGPTGPVVFKGAWIRTSL